MSDPSASPDLDLSVLRMERGPESGRPRRRRWPWVAAAAAALAVALYALPLPWRAREVEVVAAQVVSSSEAATILTSTGYTYARDRASVGAKIVGRVLRLPVEEGDRVRAGDTIAVLDGAELAAAASAAEADLAQARATEADAARDEARSARLLARGAIAPAEHDAATTRLAVASAQVRAAESRVRAARAQLGHTVVTAPLSGVVIERRVEVGEMVAPGGFTTQQSTGSIVRIADLASLEVEADINENYLARLSVGQPALIRVDAVPDATYHGRLRQIVPTADRQRAVVQVKVSIDDRDDRLLPDMSCNVTFLERPSAGGAGAGAAAAADSMPRVVVPREAVLEDGAGGPAVLRVVEGRIRRTPVELGGDAGAGRVEVLSGLSGGERLVRRPDPSLEDGARVRIAGGS